jgi:putative endonuclease
VGGKGGSRFRGNDGGNDGEMTKKLKRWIMNNQYYVYILANAHNTTLYIGMTNNLERRVYEHKTHLNKGFTHKYNVEKLVWYDVFPTPDSAILREKQLKKWNRAWKEEMINKMNPEWKDLSEGWYEGLREK